MTILISNDCGWFSGECCIRRAEQAVGSKVTHCTFCLGPTLSTILPHFRLRRQPLALARYTITKTTLGELWTLPSLLSVSFRGNGRAACSVAVSHTPALLPYLPCLLTWVLCCQIYLDRRLHEQI